MLIGRTVALSSSLGEASEVHNLFFSMNVQVVDAGTEVIHKLTQSSGRYSPIVHGFVFVEFGMHRRTDLERQAILGGYSCWDECEAQRGPSE